MVESESTKPSAYKQDEKTALRELRKLGCDRDAWWVGCFYDENMWGFGQIVINAVTVFLCSYKLDAEGAFEKILRYAICINLV